MTMLTSPAGENGIETDIYTKAALPYNVQQLQAEFHAISPREAYCELCQRFQCHPISAVAAMFSNRVGQWNETTELCFSKSYVGPKGIRPVIELCKRLPALKSLNCENNYLTNDAIFFLTRMAIHHPSLERIELSGNEFISWTGGAYLAELVTKNNRIKEIGIRHTVIPIRVAEAIFELTRRNCVLACQAIGRMPKSSNHPSAIHLRAMKRFFLDLQENGTVPASALAEGFREQLRILGRERDISTYTEAFFENLCKRAPDERIPWEAFILILRLDGCVYDIELVNKLQRVFLEFNVEPSAGIEGFVEARDLAAIYTRLYGEPPSQEEIASLSSGWSLDETMTLHWDDFLFLMYNRGPKDNKYAVGWVKTPLDQPTTLLHF